MAGTNPLTRDLRRPRGPTTRVLYIGGAGRSGSTLLGLLLANLPGFAFHGELRWLWRRVDRLEELCSCRAPFPSCEFWQRVGIRAFGGWGHVDLGRVVQDEERVVRWRHMLTLPWGYVPGTRLRRALDRYTSDAAALYWATVHESRASVLVDSSKDPPYAFFLAGHPEIDVRVVHLVRDSRAVTHSLARRVRRPDVAGERDYLPRHSAAGAALRWDGWNACFDLLRAACVPTVLLRYDDFVSDPEWTLRRIAAFCELPHAADDLSWLGSRTFEIEDHHSAAGNPLSFQQTPVSISSDDDWIQSLPRDARRTATVLTLPLLVRYGFLGYPPTVGPRRDGSA